MKRLTALYLCLCLLLCGCGGAEPENLADSVPARVVCLADPPVRSAETADFAIRLFRNSLEEGENTLVSPLSVVMALAMTANGADGQTLEQMEAALGMTTEDMNAYLYRFVDKRNDALRLANSVWLRDDESLQVEESFLEANASYYHADIFKTAFDDEALPRINSWVSENTDGKIPAILDRIPDSAVMYLINALTFEARWEEVYEPHQVREGRFTTEAGAERTVEMMHSTESLYLEDENATGFLKCYEGRKYAFAALLPEEGICVSDYAATLTGEGLQEMLLNPTEVTTHAALPKFSLEYEKELSGVLKAMGMMDAFDMAAADFSRLGHSDAGNLFISRVQHKTAITVAEKGTEAAAATSVEMRVGGAYMEDYRIVTLNRPFVYMIVDCEENVPVFAGAVMDVGDRSGE